jgi:hypothetical protein
MTPQVDSPVTYHISVKSPITSRFLHTVTVMTIECWEIFIPLHSLSPKANQNHCTPDVEEYGLEIWTHVNTSKKLCCLITDYMHSVQQYFYKIQLISFTRFTSTTWSVCCKT